MYRDALVEHFSKYINELCPDCQERYKKNPMRILDCKFDKEHIALKTAPRTIDYLNDVSRERFDKVKAYLSELEIDYEVDPGVVRGLDYYSHTVFEIEAHVDGFGTNNVLAGGGRYNGLVELLDGPSTPGIGFGLGMGRLMMALELEHISLPIVDDIEAFVMYVSDTEKMYAASLVQMLRMNGFRAETEYNGRGLKAQFKQADRLNSKFTIVLNSDDLKNNEVKVKNNKTREEELVSVDALIYYLDENIVDEESSLDEHECNCNNSSEHECSCDKTCKCKDKE